MTKRVRGCCCGGLVAMVALVVLVFSIVVRSLDDSPIDAAAYSPAESVPLEGPWAVNEHLRAARILVRGQLVGGEDVAIDGEGRIVTGTEDGAIVRVTLDGPASESMETIARTGGRPLGLRYAPDGSLIVADAVKGLLRIDDAGRVEVLTDSADGVPFRFTDDLDIAADGTVYFTDASHRFGHLQYLHDLLEARPHGRLLAYDPADGTTRVVQDGLYFANGVALSPDERFVLVNETYRYRITRCWLKGASAGTCDTFVDRLPGFPDNLSSDGRGRFWVALYTVRNPQADTLHPHPGLKNFLARLPPDFWPKPAPYGLIAELDEEGNVLRSLHDPTGEVVRNVTSVERYGDALYLGTLHQDWLARIEIQAP